MKSLKALLLSALVALPALQAAAQSEPSKVYFFESITSDNLIKAYKALGREAKGKVAIKLSTGEAGNKYFLDPQLIAPLVKMVDGTIVECNTAYGGARATTDSHRKVAADHGFSAIADVDIMDAEGEIALPVKGGKRLKENYVGKNLENYDFVVVLTHFKGHPMAGFGGALKNISIGIASSAGKSWIHSAGKTRKAPWGNTSQEAFTESMAEAAKSVIDYEGEKILYISVMNNLSVDCDCVSTPAAPKMKNVGILASLDPVALDQACVDLVLNSPDDGNKDLVERITSRRGTHILYHAALLGAGSRNYQLIDLDHE